MPDIFIFLCNILFLIILSGFFSILVAGSTSAIAWLLDPAIEKLGALKNEFIAAGAEGGIGFTAFKENAEGFEEMLTTAREKLLELEKIEIDVNDAGVLEALENTLKENVKTILGTEKSIQLPNNSLNKILIISSSLKLSRLSSIP